MKIISKTIKILPLFLLALVITSCSNDDDNVTVVPTPLNIVEIASANPNLSSLVTALQAADGDLVNVLNGSGPFTVLAPNNDAFQDLLDSNDDWNSISDIDTAVLSQVLLNHVITGDVSSSTLTGLGSGYTTTNANGAGGQNLSLYFNTSNGVRFNNVSSVISGGADVDASNGTIHIVDAVIGLPSIVDHALNNDNFTSLTGALTSEDLVTILQGEGPFTVFAPNNDAFAGFTNPNSNEFASILKNHVLNGVTLSTDLVAAGSGYTNTLANGPMDANMNMTNLSLYFNTADGVIINGGPEVIATDIVGTNGVIHVVDNVIDLPTIATFATTNDALSNLVAALQLADTGTPTVPWIGTVSDVAAGPFTVFAPTNDAFADLLLELDPSGDTALGDLDPATVDAVLLMHVVNGNVVSGDLATGTVTTLGGDLSLDLDTLTLTDGLMRNIGIIPSLIDIQGVNGVVHVVDTVIRPAP